MGSYNTEAVILKANKLNEADKIYTFYTPFHGKKQAIAKGVRRLTSRRSGNLEVFNQTDLKITEGKSLDIVVEASSRDSFPKLRADLDKVALAYQVIELTDQFGQEEQENKALFDLVLEALKKLNSDVDAQKALIVFKVKLLNIVGFRPVFDQCVRCGSSENLEFFSNALGGMLDENCAEADLASIPVSDSLIKAISFFQNQPETQILRARISDRLKSEVNNIVDSYIEYILEKSLRSKKFLTEVSNLS